jgi:5-methylcytosine-specific restriction endonuclease McrA
MARETTTAERRRVARRKWAAKNREYGRLKSKQWRKDNPDKCREQSRQSKRRRRARKNDAPFLWSPDIRIEVIEYWGSKCVYCGSDHEHFDHFIPVVMGGGTTPWNMLTSCAGCNQSKGPKDPLDWPMTLKTKMKIERGITHFKELYEDNLDS